MTVMNPTTPTELLPQPNGNGAGTVPAPVVAAAASALAVDPEITKKMDAIRDLGQQIKKKEREKSKQETVCAEVKSTLDTERDALHKIEHTLEELHDELATLAVGKSSERLPFGKSEKSDGKPTQNITENITSDAWRAVTLSSLTPTIKPAKLKALVENHPPIETLGELSDWQAKKGEWWAKDLKGLGDGGREQIEKACEAYYLANPIQLAKPAENDVKVSESTASTDTAPFDDATIKDDTAEGIIKMPGVCFLDVAQRAGGKWAARFKVSLGKAGLASSPGNDPGWLGDHPSRVHAIAAGLDAIFDFVKPLQRKGLAGKAKKEAAAIVSAIDKLDKSIYADLEGDGTPDDIKQFWADRPAREVEEVPAKKGKAKKAGKK